jgi:hypothetical protein
MAIGRPISLTPNVKSKKINVTATADQTSFTPAGGYRVNAISVYRNGVRLVEGTDFTAFDGTTVTLISASTVSDIISFEIFDTFPLADTISANASDQTIDGNVTVTGTLTVDSFTDINVSGSATIDGQLSVGGTITYEDVTNVDSVGIVTGGLGLRALAGGIQVVGIYTGLKAGISTFSNDISIHGTAGVGAGTSIKWNASANKLRFNDNTQAEWGDGSDLQIYHDGSTNVVDSASANLEIRHGAEKMIACAQDGQVELWYDNSKKLETSTAGVVVTGISTADDFTIGIGGTSVHTALGTKASTGKAIAMAMIFG